MSALHASQAHGELLMLVGVGEVDRLRAEDARRRPNAKHSILDNDAALEILRKGWLWALVAWSYEQPVHHGVGEYVVVGITTGFRVRAHVFGGPRMRERWIAATAHLQRYFTGTSPWVVDEEPPWCTEHEDCVATIALGFECKRAKMKG
jgi:hypothetical protein